MTSLLQAVMTATLAFGGVAEPSNPPPTPPPSPPPIQPLAERFDVLGVQVCVGAVDDAQPCDLRLWAPPRTTAAAKPDAPTTTASTQTRRFTLFGRTVCLGPSRDPSRDGECDVTLDPSPSDSEA